MSNRLPIFSIVYLNYNKISETRKTTEQLLTLTKDIDWVEIIAIDNNSTDGTQDYLRQKSSDVKTLLLAHNYGIEGYNRGFKIARGKFILVLDDDSSPIEKTLFKDLLDIFETQADIGAIACHIVDDKGLDQWSWHLPKNKKSGLSTAFVGCGFAIRRDLFELIGWYPETFFIYENEAKVAFEIRKAGYEIYYEENCFVQHRADLTQRPGWRRVFYPTRNNLWLIRQYYPLPIAYYMIFSRLLMGLINSSRLGMLKAWLKGANEGLCAPIEKNPLNSELQNKFKAYFYQNSIFHQLLKII